MTSQSIVTIAGLASINRSVCIALMHLSTLAAIWAPAAHFAAGPRADSYRQALDCPCNDSDRRFLLRRLAEIEDERS